VAGSASGASCGECGRPVERAYRFCPWCGTPLRPKLTEFFPGAQKTGDGERALRVSAYLSPDPDERHVRLSVWDEHGVAEAAISVGDAEAARLASFLHRSQRTARRPNVADRVRRAVAALREH
jgi:hypothetical protein